MIHLFTDAEQRQRLRVATRHRQVGVGADVTHYPELGRRVYRVRVPERVVPPYWNLGEATPDHEISRFDDVIRLIEAARPRRGAA